MNYLEEPLGEIVVKIPGASKIFHDYNLDFCCQGHHTLNEACAKKSIDAGLINLALTELARSTEVSTSDSITDTNELIDHILSRYHEKHREQLPELIRMAARVEQVHGMHEECPLGLTDHLAAMQGELESHMLKEETILFPMLRNGIFPEGPIAVMESEHVAHGDALEMLMQLTNQLRLPEGACNTWTALYVGLTAFKEDIMAHIHLENFVLFKAP